MLLPGARCGVAVPGLRRVGPAWDPMEGPFSFRWDWGAGGCSCQVPSVPRSREALCSASCHPKAQCRAVTVGFCGFGPSLKQAGSRGLGGLRTPLGTTAGWERWIPSVPALSYPADISRRQGQSTGSGPKIGSNAPPGLGWAELSPPWGAAPQNLLGLPAPGGSAPPQPPQHQLEAELPRALGCCRWRWVLLGGFWYPPAPTPILGVPLPSSVPPGRGQRCPHVTGGVFIIGDPLPALGS